jgi:very-short-patch-repair endonuclease
MACSECPHCHALSEEALCESPVETTFLREIRKDRMFDAFQPNTPVQLGGPTGIRYRIDFADIHTLVGIEIDGRAYHSDKETFTNDRLRQRRLEVTGWRIIRFSADEIINDVEHCVYQLRGWLKVVRGDLNPLVTPGPVTGRARLGGRAERAAARIT